MITTPRLQSGSDTVSEQIAARVFARASELDSAHQARATIAELRAAAVEAGISAYAFDAALAEIRNVDMAVPAQFRQPRRWRPRTWALLAGLLFIMGTSTVAVAALLFVSTDVPVEVTTQVPDEA